MVDVDGSRYLKVLILEDVGTDAELMRRTLEKEGFFLNARIADDQASFRGYLENFRPDLILADYQLPTFSGLDALIISQEMDREIPFIFVTGTVGEEIAAETILNGASGFVLKSNLPRLATIVSELFQPGNSGEWNSPHIQRARKRIDARIKANQDLLEKINKFLSQHKDSESKEDKELKVAINKLLEDK